ncbi:hypothetical protein Tco_0223338 [Tanacetum coccineum]
MLVDALMQHEGVGQVNRMVEKVRCLQIKQEVVETAKEVAEVGKEVVEVAKVSKEVVEMAKIVIRVFKEVVKVTKRMEVVMESLTLLLSSLSIAKPPTYYFSTSNVRTVNMNNGRGGCSYKEFIACNPKDYDGKGDAIVQTRGREAAVGMAWEDLKVLLMEEFCPNNEIQKLETELVPHLVTLGNKRIERYIYGLALQIRAMVEAIEPTTIYSVLLKAGLLTDEAIRNGALKKIT